MTHFNHDWDTTKTPAVPVSIGDRYYAQDLNDDFNYLKHLPYEVFLQGRSRGVMVAPSDTWRNDTNTLTLSGGFGVISQDCIELDPDEDFIIPPKTHSSPRYERVPFADTTLILPSDDSKAYYIVATPTKRSLLQRTKALFTEQYASRVRYDGIITIQEAAPTAGQILVGLCCYKEYCLLIDNSPDQCKDNIILKKWFGQNKITQNFVSALQSYYNTSIASIKTKITITSSNDGINGGTFNNCIITINRVNTVGINGGTFNNCIITINTVSSYYDGINGGTFNNCIITINTVNIDGFGINSGIFNNCTITINTVNTGGTTGGTFNNCIITINKVNAVGIDGGTFNNCTITINTVNAGGFGINSGIFNNCTITINTVDIDGFGINNTANITLCLTYIDSASNENLLNTNGKLNILNDTVLHVS